MICIPQHYFSGDEIKKNKMDRGCITYGERRGAYWVLVEKPEGRRPLGKTIRIWKDNIKMDLRDMGCGGSDWIDLVQDRDRWRALVNTVMNFRVP
jgi:hypothetical protein